MKGDRKKPKKKKEKKNQASDSLPAQTTNKVTKKSTN